MNPVNYCAAVLIGAAAVGLAAAGLFAGYRRLRPGAGVAPQTALQRAASYAALAFVLAIAALAGTPGVALLCAVLAGVGLIEWGRLTDLPAQHRIALQVANVAIVAAVAVRGPEAAEALIGGLVLIGIAWPVVRADTGRAIRDLGIAAVGCIVLSVLLVHGVALSYRYGELGTSLFVALAVACAVSDVAAFLIGRSLGRTPLAPTLSPNKTRAGAVGNVVGAAIGLAVFAPILLPWLGPAMLLVFIPLVAFGAIWGDLLESAVKREFGVKDAGSWLPGFGGILDRIDSLLVVLPLAYWSLRLVEVNQP